MSTEKTDPIKVIISHDVDHLFAKYHWFRDLCYPGTDYYSFGITLYTLFCGHTPYAGAEGKELERYIELERLPFPAEMPQSLQDLILGLTYPDISTNEL